MAQRFLDGCFQDIRSALRRLTRTPGVSALLIFTLALGIGANAAIFGVARSVLTVPVPYVSPDRVVMLELNRRDLPVRITEGQAYALRASGRSFERVEAFSTLPVVWRRGDSAVRLRSRVVTPGLPEAMGVRPVVGRRFGPSEGAPNSEPVALISERMWRTHFASRRDVIGLPLTLGEDRRVVVGVIQAPAPAEDVDVWVPRQLQSEGNWFPQVVAWVRAGVSVEQANAEVATIYASPLGDGPDQQLRARVVRPGDREKDSPVAQTMLLFWAASAFVLAIVCTNLMNLVLARNLAGEREFAIRAALGASRGKIMRLVLAESLLVGVLGGAGGLLVGMWGARALLAMRPLSLSLVYPEQVSIDATVASYAFALSLLSGLTLGVLPALRAGRADPLRGTMRGDGQVERGVPVRWLFGGAVTLQTALAIVLLVGAGLMVSSYARLRQVAPGFEPDNLVEMTVRLGASGHSSSQSGPAFFAQLAQRIAIQTGIQDATVASDAPPHGTVMTAGIEFDDRSEAGDTIEASWVRAAPNYWQVLRIPVVEGRLLADADRDGVVVVSESFAGKFWPDGGAVGKRFRLRREKGWEPWLQVVGVSGDVMGRGLRDNLHEVYVPYASGRGDSAAILARVERNPLAAFQLMKEQVWALDPNLPITDIRTVTQGLERSIDEQPFYSALLATFAAVALVLAVVGVFGVTSHMASRRQQEIGIRMALGARPSDVARLMVVQGIVPSVAGTVLGLVGAGALARIMQSLVYGVSVTDAAVYAITAGILFSASFLATWIPVRRATSIDASAVMRGD